MEAIAQTQAALWNGTAGRGWIAAQPLLDAMYRPFESVLAEAAIGMGDISLLDIGCGTGGTTVALAEHLGPASRCTGIDISAPMIAAARVRAGEAGVNADFIAADAGDYAFAPQSFDLLVSRFGVMFFADPVGAFAHLHGAAKPGARLRFVVWREAEVNPFLTAAERVAAPLLPALTVPPPGAPGPFGFADRARIESVLAASGWCDVEIVAVARECAFPEAGLDTYLSVMGPVGRVLQSADAATRGRILEKVRPAFAPFIFGDEVRFDAACWLVDARRQC
jgi:SAM-dependent methyltransferase